MKGSLGMRGTLRCAQSDKITDRIYDNRYRIGLGSFHRFKIKAAVNMKPEEYSPYFEDFIFAPNAEIGPVKTS